MATDDRSSGSANDADPATQEKDLSRSPTLNSTSRDVNRNVELSTTTSRVPTASKNPEFGILREVAFVSTVISAQLLTQAALAQSIAPLHVIGDSFGTKNPGQLSWLPAGFSLTVGTFILPAGRWGDLYGHKKLFVAGWLWFALWSLIAGFSVYSRSLVFFAFCRGMQGIGPAILLPNGIAILARTYPAGGRKNMVLSLFGACAPGGYVLGAVFSGIFTQFVWWPWSYWVLGMVTALLAVISCLTIPPMPVAGGRPTLQEFDIVGTTLGVSGLILFNFAWNEGAGAGWQKVYVYVLLIVGVAFFAAFVWFERHRAASPLIPVEAFTRDTNLVFGCVALGWASFGIWVFYFWQFLEVLKGNSILLTTAKVCPVAFSGATAAIVTGLLIRRVQPGIIMLISMCAFCTGTILLATNPLDRSYWAQYFVSTLVVTWGMDMSFPSSVIVLSNHMPPEKQGIAASLVNTVINYSISIGLGMGGTVESHVNNGGKNLLKGYRGAWYLGIGFDGLGIILAVCLIFSWRATLKKKQKARLEQKPTV